MAVNRVVHGVCGVRVCTGINEIQICVCVCVCVCVYPGWNGDGMEGCYKRNTIRCERREINW